MVCFKSELEITFKVISSRKSDFNQCMEARLFLFFRNAEIIPSIPKKRNKREYMQYLELKTPKFFEIELFSSKQ